MDKVKFSTSIHPFVFIVVNDELNVRGNADRLARRDFGFSGPAAMSLTISVGSGLNHFRLSVNCSAVFYY